MAEIKSSLVNSEDMKFVKQSLLRASAEDGKEAFRVKTLEYINDSASSNADQFFYDMLEYVRFLTKAEGEGHIAFTDPNCLIYLNCPDAENGPGEKIRVWDFIYCHECLHQLWDTFAVGDRIKEEGHEYNHMLLNIASDCVINDYLSFYRKKERFENGIFPDVLEKDYGVQYDRKKDTQYTLYLKLLEMKDQYQEKYEKMKNDTRFNGKLMPDHVEEAPSGSGPTPPQEKHSDDYIKGYTQGIKDALDGKVDPKTFTPKTPKNDYDKGYNDVMKEIKEGMEKGVQMSKDNDGGNNPGSDLPQIPWDTPQKPQQNQKNDSGEGQQNNSDSSNDAQQSANSAQQSANSAQQSANKAKEKAEKTGDSQDKEAAKQAQEQADKAKEAANKAKEAAANGDSEQAQKAANEAAEAAANASSLSQDSDESASNAQKAAQDARQAADDAKKAAEEIEKKLGNSNKEENQKAVKSAKRAAENANEAATKAEEAAQKAKEASKKGDTTGARKASAEAEFNKHIAENNKKIAQNADKKNNSSDNGQQSSSSNTSASKQPTQGGKGHFEPIETEAELAEIRKEAKAQIERYKKKLSGDLGKFITQCNASKECKKEGLEVTSTGKGVSGWNTKMNTSINSFVKQKIFQKKRQYESTYSRVRRGSGFIKFGDPIMPGKKVREDKFNINVAFYVDRSGSMDNCIKQVFDAAYVISDSLKKNFGKDPVIDKTEFRMFVFDDELDEIKWGSRTNSRGGTMPFQQLIDGISKATKDYLINVIITDAGFGGNDADAVNDLIKEIDGILLFITNVPSPTIQNISKKNPTKFIYIEADPNFKLD